MAIPTEEELLILNSIIYESSFSTYFSVNTDATIYKWAKKFNKNSIDDSNKPAEISKEEFSNIIDTIRKNPDVYDNMIVKNIENTDANTNGDQKVTNATISYGDNEIIVYKGTGGDLEWRDNGEGAYSEITDTKQQIQALDYYDRMVKKFGEGKNIYVTGHSKGGNKAQYVGVLRGSEIEHVYAFDGQGFGQAFLIKYKDLIQQNKNKITNISNEYDFVNILLFSVAGERKYITSSTTFGILDGSSFAIDDSSNILDIIKGIGGKAFIHKIGGWHSPYSMLTLKDGQLVLNDVVEQSHLMKEIQDLFAHYALYMDEEDFRFVVYTIMGFLMKDPDAYGEKYEMPEGFISRLLFLTKGYIENNKGFDFVEIYPILCMLFGDCVKPIKIWIMYQCLPSEDYALIVRDFSDDVKDELIHIVEEVDAEPWYDVTRWDLFYRVEKFLGGLDFPSNSQDLDEYYRKIIDIQNVSQSQINQIFEDVKEYDDTFSKKLSEVNSHIIDINTTLNNLNNQFHIE